MLFASALPYVLRSQGGNSEDRHRSGKNGGHNVFRCGLERSRPGIAGARSGAGSAAFPKRSLRSLLTTAPSANITPQILDTLRQHRAVATFFVMGQQVKQYPRLLQQEAAAGHVIGYHTYTHALRPTLSQAEREMEQTRQIVQQAIGRDTTLFRPPYGNTRSNYTRIARDQNYAIILWNVSGADTATRDADVVLENCTANVHSGDILLMHDSSTKSHTARAPAPHTHAPRRAGFLFCYHPRPSPPVRRRSRLAARQFTNAS